MAFFTRTCSLLVLLLAAVPAAADDGADEAKAQLVRAMFETRSKHLQSLKQFDRVVSAQELPRLSVRRGQFDVSAGAINPTPVQRIKVAGSDASWAVGTTGAGVTITSLEYLDAKKVEGDGIWNAILTVRADAIYVSVRGGTKSNLETYTINQRKGAFSVIVRSTPVAGAALAGRMRSISAESCEQFQRNSPEEYKRYVAPVIELLGLAGLLKPGAADIYRVFGELQPTQETEGQLLEIVTAMASADPAQRTGASQQLEKLGPAGALAALRMDRSILTPEQASRIDAFLRSQSSCVGDPRRLRHDPLFLVDCLEDADVRVRKLAMDGIKTALNRDVAIDVTADAESLHQAVDMLRKQITDGIEKASVKPIMTTQPAATRPRLEIE